MPERDRRALSKKKPGRIPAEAALVHSEDEGNRNVHISFEHYAENQCEISSLLQAEAREGLDSLKRIASGPAKTIGERNIRMAPVSETGNYRPLFRYVEKGVDRLNHHNLGTTGRVFFHIVGRTCYVVAFTRRHY